MAKSFKILQAKMTPQARARSQTLAKRIMANMALREFGNAYTTTQEKLSRLGRLSQSHRGNTRREDVV